jgi:hypothetical protein
MFGTLCMLAVRSCFTNPMCQTDGEHPLRLPSKPPLWHCRQAPEQSVAAAWLIIVVSMLSSTAAKYGHLAGVLTHQGFTVTKAAVSKWMNWQKQLQHKQDPHPAGS